MNTLFLQNVHQNTKLYCIKIIVYKNILKKLAEQMKTLRKQDLLLWSYYTYTYNCTLITDNDPIYDPLNEYSLHCGLCMDVCEIAYKS